MFKTMLKKQLLSFKNFFTNDRGTGKRRSKLKIVGFSLLMILVFVSLGISMFAIAFLLGDSLLSPGFMMVNRHDWLYFSMMGAMTLAFGVVGSVFTTYSTIYKAKDNDLLLSMPIKTEYIVGSRLVSIMILAFAYSSIVWIPTMVAYWIIKLPGNIQILLPILLWIVNALFILSISCALGYLVARISAVLPKNNFVTIALYLVFFAGYYYCCFNLDSLLEAFVSNAENVGSSISKWMYPIYLLGNAANGGIEYFFGYLGLSIGLFAICWILLNKSFISVATGNKGTKKVKYVEKHANPKGLRMALLGREIRHLTSSVNYMMNCALGMPIMIIACGVIIYKGSDLLMAKEMMMQVFPELEGMLPAFVVSAVLTMLSMTDVTAPSVSLEGKNLWAIRVLPVKTKDILRAKSDLGMVVGLLPAMLVTLAMGLTLKIELATVGTMLILVFLYTALFSDFGLMMNLLRPSLDWSNEIGPVKQSIPVFVCIFGGFVVAAGIAAGAYFLRDYITGVNYLLALVVLLSALCRLVKNWLFNKGVEIFESL